MDNNKMEGEREMWKYKYVNIEEQKNIITEAYIYYIFIYIYILLEGRKMNLNPI